MKLINIAGKKYGSLTAIRVVGRQEKNRNSIWEFSCDCGEVESICAYDVKTGKRISCKKCKLAGKNFPSNSQEYKIWTDIKTRCYNKNHRSYGYYGARGIKVCDRWVNSFDNFISDVGPRPSKDHSIDRIDFNLGYSPENCRWATNKEQARNKRNNVFVEYNGKKMLLVEASEKSGIPVTCLRARLLTGSDLFEPLKNKGSITFKGVTDTLRGWEKRTGLKASTIAMRINKYGYSIEEALTTGATKNDYS